MCVPLSIKLRYPVGGSTCCQVPSWHRRTQSWSREWKLGLQQRSQRAQSFKVSSTTSHTSHTPDGVSASACPDSNSLSLSRGSGQLGSDAGCHPVSVLSRGRLHGNPQPSGREHLDVVLPVLHDGVRLLWPDWLLKCLPCQKFAY